MTATRTDTKTDLKIRGMIRADMQDVLDIEWLCFEFPWSKQDFIRTLKAKEVIGMVAEVGEKKNRQIIGYMIYDLYKGRIELLNLAVESSTWRCGVGRALIEKLKAKLSPKRRRAITAMVREHNTDAQKFFAALGFQALSVLRRAYEEDQTTEDAIHFRFLHEET